MVNAMRRVESVLIAALLVSLGAPVCAQDSTVVIGNAPVGSSVRVDMGVLEGLGPLPNVPCSKDIGLDANYSTVRGFVHTMAMSRGVGSSRRSTASGWSLVRWRMARITGGRYQPLLTPGPRRWSCRGYLCLGGHSLRNAHRSAAVSGSRSCRNSVAGSESRSAAAQSTAQELAPGSGDHLPDLPGQAQRIPRSEARTQLVTRLVDNVVAATQPQIQRAFGVFKLTHSEMDRTLAELLETGQVIRATINGLPDQTLVSSRAVELMGTH